MKKKFVLIISFLFSFLLFFNYDIIVNANSNSNSGISTFAVNYNPNIKIGKITVRQFDKQKIPSSPIKSSENIVNQGKLLYRMKYKVTIYDMSNKPIYGASPFFSTTSTYNVKGMKATGRTDSNGEIIFEIDIRDSGSFNFTISCNNVKSTHNDIIRESCAYESSFYTTGYIIVSENDYSRQKISALGINGKTFKSDFLDAVKLNGSGEASDGSSIRYNGTTRKYELSKALTSSGTVPTKDKTIAVDNYFIPLFRISGNTHRRGSVYIYGIGTRIAEDSGGSIKNYRIDIFRGKGKSAMSGFTNANRVVNFEKIIVY